MLSGYHTPQSAMDLQPGRPSAYGLHDSMGLEGGIIALPTPHGHGHGGRPLHT